jgi:two-component system, OmpR family, response regulator
MSDSALLKTAVIIEDDADIRHILVEVFEAAGFSTVSVGNGIDGVRAVLRYQPMITTLDVNMPGIDGIEAARRIRVQSDTYIIMITALQDEADVVMGLASGADEYLVKPFRPRELRARIEAIMRRTRAGSPGGGAPAAPSVPVQDSVGPTIPTWTAATATSPAPAASAGEPVVLPTVDDPGASDVVEVDDASVVVEDGPDGEWLRHRDLRLEPASRLVSIGSRPIELTRTEFDLLATLMESKRRVRSKADLTLVLRGESYVTTYFVGDADKRAIEAHMTNLRRKLGDDPSNPRYIETVRGVGYRLTSELMTSP